MSTGRLFFNRQTSVIRISLLVFFSKFCGVSKCVSNLSSFFSLCYYYSFTIPKDMTTTRTMMEEAMAVDTGTETTTMDGPRQ